MDRDTEWVTAAKRLFVVERPQHFTNFNHCDECEEHDETLRNSSVDDIGLRELGSPAWDPLAFSSARGIAYYFPALIRLSLETIADENYFEQLLFHLEYGGEHNRLLESFTPEQRKFVSDFIAYLILNFTDELDLKKCLDDAARVHDLWAG